MSRHSHNTLLFHKKEQLVASHNNETCANDFDLYHHLENTGCHHTLEALQDCLGENNRDYRQCQHEVHQFRDCFRDKNKSMSQSTTIRDSFIDKKNHTIPDIRSYHTCMLDDWNYSTHLHNSDTNQRDEKMSRNLKDNNHHIKDDIILSRDVRERTNRKKISSLSNNSFTRASQIMTTKSLFSHSLNKIAASFIFSVPEHAVYLIEHTPNTLLDTDDIRLFIPDHVYQELNILKKCLEELSSIAEQLYLSSKNLSSLNGTIQTAFSMGLMKQVNDFRSGFIWIIEPFHDCVSPLRFWDVLIRWRRYFYFLLNITLFCFPKKQHTIIQRRQMITLNSLIPYSFNNQELPIGIDIVNHLILFYNHLHQHYITYVKDQTSKQHVLDKNKECSKFVQDTHIQQLTLCYWTVNELCLWLLNQCLEPIKVWLEDFIYSVEPSPFFTSSYNTLLEFLNPKSVQNHIFKDLNTETLPFHLPTFLENDKTLIIRLRYVMSLWMCLFQQQKTPKMTENQSIKHLDTNELDRSHCTNDNNTNHLIKKTTAPSCFNSLTLFGVNLTEHCCLNSTGHIIDKYKKKQKNRFNLILTSLSDDAFGHHEELKASIHVKRTDSFLNHLLFDCFKTTSILFSEYKNIFTKTQTSSRMIGLNSFTIPFVNSPKHLITIDHHMSIQHQLYTLWSKPLQELVNNLETYLISIFLNSRISHHITHTIHPIVINSWGLSLHICRQFVLFGNMSIMSQVVKKLQIISTQSQNHCYNAIMTSDKETPQNVLTNDAISWTAQTYPTSFNTYDDVLSLLPATGIHTINTMLTDIFQECIDQDIIRLEQLNVPQRETVYLKYAFDMLKFSIHTNKITDSYDWIHHIIVVFNSQHIFNNYLCLFNQVSITGETLNSNQLLSSLFILLLQVHLASDTLRGVYKTYRILTRRSFNRIQNTRSRERMCLMSIQYSFYKLFRLYRIMTIITEWVTYIINDEWKDLLILYQHFQQVQSYHLSSYNVSRLEYLTQLKNHTISQIATRSLILKYRTIDQIVSSPLWVLLDSIRHLRADIDSIDNVMQTVQCSYSQFVRVLQHRQSNYKDHFWIEEMGLLVSP